MDFLSQLMPSFYNSPSLTCVRWIQSENTVDMWQIVLLGQSERESSESFPLCCCECHRLCPGQLDLPLPPPVPHRQDHLRHGHHRPVPGQHPRLPGRHRKHDRNCVMFFFMFLNNVVCFKIQIQFPIICLFFFSYLLKNYLFLNNTKHYTSRRWGKDIRGVQVPAEGGGVRGEAPLHRASARETQASQKAARQPAGAQLLVLVSDIQTSFSQLK